MVPLALNIQGRFESNTIAHISDAEYTLVSPSCQSTVSSVPRCCSITAVYSKLPNKPSHAAAKLAPFAKQYGLNLEAVVQAGKGEGGVAAATAELSLI